MDVVLQAVIMGLVQGLTEFLPISSSGHLVLVPWLAGWEDAFIGSLSFSVMLHLATLGALLAYFAGDWRRLVPAGLAALRDRSFADDPDRRLAWLLAATTVPAAVAGYLLNDPIERTVRQPGLVAVMLVVGGAILWLAERHGRRQRPMEALSFRTAVGIGCAQALALVPGISRSGISIAAGLFAGLEREAAARFSFLMATPIIAGAGLYEARQLAAGAGDAAVLPGPLVAGMLAAFLSAVAAIHVLLRFLRRHRTDVFVAYRVGLAALVVIVFLNR